MGNGKVLFTGCSFTAGFGWSADSGIATLDTDKRNKNLWVNICCSNINELQRLELINDGVPGASNTEIFERTIQNIAINGKEIKIIFCQWTGGFRYNFDPGLERWYTRESLTTRNKKIKNDIKLSNGFTWSRKKVFDLLDNFLMLHHIHWEIVKIIRYTNILKNLVKLHCPNTKIYFINGLCPWDENYFIKLHNVLPEHYTDFTKKEVLEINKDVTSG